MQNILFGLRVISASLRGTGGVKNTISIYEDGTIQYDRFTFHSDVPVSSVKVRKGSTIVKEIQKVLTKYKKDIERIYFCIDNRSCDGACYTFIFYDKAISIDNPYRHKKGDVITPFQYGAMYIPSYEENDIFLAYYNNTLLDIREKISAILAKPFTRCSVQNEKSPARFL